MPAFLKQDSLPDVVQSFIAMFEVLKGKLPTYALSQHGLNNPGNCKGLLVEWEFICDLLNYGVSFGT